MTKLAERPLFTFAELLATGNLDLARRATEGDESAKRSLEIGIRESMLKAKNTPFTLMDVDGKERKIG